MWTLTTNNRGWRFFSWDGGIFAKEIGGIQELKQQIVHGDTRNMLQRVYLQHMAYGNYTQQQQTWGRLKICGYKTWGSQPTNRFWDFRCLIFCQKTMGRNGNLSSFISHREQKALNEFSKTSRARVQLNGSGRLMWLMPPILWDILGHHHFKKQQHQNP